MQREIYDTPILTLDEEILEKNLRQMSRFAKENHLRLTPHIKSHKIPELARRQIEEGATGITAAKLGEAEVMADHGLEKILLAYPIVTEVKMERLFQLSKRVRLGALVDTFEGIRRLGSFFASYQRELPVFLKIDTGLHRCGVPPGEEAIELAKHILSNSGLSFLGILTHAGHVYGAQNHREVESIAREEGEVMVELKEKMEDRGISVPCVSVGSTPTVGISGRVDGVTEIRPGNYIFHDAMQIALGVVNEDRCALRVKTTVVSRHQGRAIIDAGSKALGLDRGAHGKGSLQGYGLVIEKRGITINALSEEHGIIHLSPNEKGFSVGDVLTIIPNHACAVVNLFPLIYRLRGDRIIGSYKVAAGRKMQ